ncbi:MAG: (2Fe-2S)-binding protein [Candidatus Thermoplasmatota archaeon]
MGDKTFICRCEDITIEEIEEAIDQGYNTLTLLKNHLRLGMGPCQGRGCLTLARRILCQKTGKRPSEIEYPSTRPPETPILIGVLASGEEE